MRAIPDLTNTEAMARRGRGSVLVSSRNEACELLRDSMVRLQSADLFRDDIAGPINDARSAIDRLEALQKLASNEGK